MKKWNVAVVGATGAVGREMVKILESRKYPVKNLKLLASERSAGSYINYNGRDYVVEKLKEDSFYGMNIALFSAGGAVSEKFAPHAVNSDCIVIDNTSAFRMVEEIPLVVPEVNRTSLAMYKNRGIIANPNCSTIQMVVALKPIHDAVKIKRIIVSTYQAVSGTGKRAIQELTDQSRDILAGKKPSVKVYPHQIAFNCLPHIDVFLDNGYTKEEMKMILETKKIMSDQSIGVTATTVRVPVFYGHSESVNIETEKKITPAEVISLLEKAPGVSVIDDPSSQRYPLAVLAAGLDNTFVGRIREDHSISNGINMWIVADNLRKGAALNAVQIAEIMITDYL